MAKVNGSFKIEIPKTADLTPPALECDWEVEFDGDPEFEKVLLAYYKKNYEDALKKAMGDQVKGYALPLASMQKEIDGMKKMLEYVQAQSDPALAQAGMEAFKKKYTKPLNELVEEYNDYLAKAVENTRKQQLLVYGKKFEEEALAAAKKAVKRDVKNKKFRHIAGLVIKGALVLGLAAAGIAAIVLTFGTAGVVFAGIAAASAGLGGLSAIVKTGKSLYDVRDLERRSLDLLLKDVSSLTGKLDGVETQLSGIGKHINDVSTYYSDRKRKTAKLAQAMAEADKALKDMIKGNAQLKGLTPKIHKAQEAKLATAEQNLAKAKAAWEQSSQRDAALERALDNAKAALLDLGKVPFQGAKSKMAGLTQIDFKSADTYIAALDNLAGVSGAVGGIGMAKTSK